MWVSHQISGEQALDKLFDKIQNFERNHQEDYQDNKREYKRWVFRGKHSRFQLKSGLERACDKARIEPGNRFKVEGAMMREFRDWYNGKDKNNVMSDDLYCLSLMQHFGAPTRLVDWSYSKYVALYFALESAKDDMRDDEKKTSCTIWCLNTEWLNEAMYQRAPEIGLTKDLLDDIGKDEKREAAAKKIFRFGEEVEGHRELVIQMEPLHFHGRQYAQQTVFLCPCDLTKSFEENLEPMLNASTPGYRIVCELGLDAALDGLERLRRMNISRASLFPGLEGFTKSLAYRLKFLEKSYDRWQPYSELQ